MNLLYLVGPPGAGKSSAMTALTAGCTRHYRARPLHHDLLVNPASGDPVAVELGRARPGFPGTDTLPLNVAPTAAGWVATRPAGLLLAEGDRLAHLGFLDAAERAGYAVHLAYLTAPGYVLDGRCAGRGSTQNDAWRRGRATKAARLADTCDGRYPVQRVDTTTHDHPAQVAAAIRTAHPFLDVLPEVPA